MGLKSGLYVMLYKQYEEHDEDFDDEKYTKCLGAAYVGDVPGEFSSVYFKTLIEQFNTRYGGDQRSFRFDFYHPDLSKNAQGESTPTKEQVAEGLIKYENGSMLPDHKEALDFAVGGATAIRQAIDEEMPTALANSSEPALQPVGEEKSRKAKDKTREEYDKLGREGQNAKKMLAVQFAIANPDIDINLIEKKYGLPDKSLSRTEPTDYPKIIKAGRAETRRKRETGTKAGKRDYAHTLNTGIRRGKTPGESDYETQDPNEN